MSRGASPQDLGYPRRTLTIAPVEEFPTPSPEAPVFRIPFRLTNEAIRVTAKFPNGYQADLVVDTGASADFVLTTATVHNAGLGEAVRQGRPRTMQGIGGGLMEIGFSINAIDLGGRRFSGTRSLTTSWSTHDLIGTGWLSQYRATFDFRRQLLWLERPAVESQK